MAFHSYRGGTGKTSVAASIADLYIAAGKNVCLLDYDFRAPSLNVLFKDEKPTSWLNNFLDGEVGIEEVLVDLNQRSDSKGKFFVGFADPSPEAEREIMSKGKKWQIGALRRILSANEFILDKLNMDYIFFDTAPGYTYASVNAITTSNEVVLVMSTSDFDTIGTVHMIEGIYKLLDKEVRLLVNKVPMTLIPSEAEKAKLADWYRDKCEMEVLGLVPCYCDVLAFSGKPFFTLQYPQHPYSVALKAVAEKLEL